MQNLANDHGFGGAARTVQAQSDALPGHLGNAMGSVVTVTTSIISSLTALGAIMVLTFFLLHDDDRLVGPRWASVRRGINPTYATS